MTKLISTSKLCLLAALYNTFTIAFTLPGSYSSTTKKLSLIPPRLKFTLFSNFEYLDDVGSELFHREMSSTTPEFLAALWYQISQGCKYSKGQSNTVIYPNMIDRLNDPSFIEPLMVHLDNCKDVCDDFGVNTILSPYSENKGGKSTVVGFTVKSFKDRNKIGTFASDGNFEFAPDPLWNDDDWDLIESEIKAAAAEDADADDDGESDLSDLPEIVDRIPDNDDQIVTTTKTWVNKMMSDMGICPFTKGADLAGLPMGNVFYTVDRATSVEDVYFVYWKEVVRVQDANEKDLSTTLLILPEFLIDNVEIFENFSNSLTQPLESLHVEDLLQLVFFHPEWTFRDGGERSGIGSAANYARRSPWPMINILRTSQVRTAQKGIPTGLVYQQNEKTLSKVGTKTLEKMLRLRDWTEIAEVKVDRKDMEALRVAQDLQTTGAVTAQDTSVVYDSTPAANKIDRKQIEGGNIINVVLQALEKRLLGADGAPQQLTGAETSAAMMASDFLLEHLDYIENNPSRNTDNINPMARAYFDVEDEFDQSKVTNEDESEVLFGAKGITRSNDDDPYSAGMDPRSFY